LSIKPPVALLGWSLEAMEGMDKLGRRFVVVAPEAFGPAAAENGLDFVAWDFERLTENSGELANALKDKGVSVAVPLYEECVTWAGAINGMLRDDPRLFNRYHLFRDKAMMKRKAQMSGLRVGVFEEADSKEDARRFFKRVQKALLKLEGEVDDPIHIKPVAAAGSVGHKMIREESDIDGLDETLFPCLMESHLDGQEFSCEVFVHERKIRFLNITEYIRLGHSNYVPASPGLNERRPLIRTACEQLIEAFDIEYGMIHPEWFITSDGKLNFGEVAARVPGGHIFQLIQMAYGFDPFAAFALCCDPTTTEDELAEFFPDEADHERFAGCLMVYPKGKVAKELHFPEELEADDFFVSHNLFVPATPKVADRVGFGNHYGTIFFKGDDPERMRKLLLDYEEYDFYTGDDDE